jgi:hypothetical protein
VQGGRWSRHRGRHQRGGDQAKLNGLTSSLHHDVGYSIRAGGHNERQAVI